MFQRSSSNQSKANSKTFISRLPTASRLLTLYLNLIGISIGLWAGASSGEIKTMAIYGMAGLGGASMFTSIFRSRSLEQSPVLASNFVQERPRVVRRSEPYRPAEPMGCGTRLLAYGLVIIAVFLFLSIAGSNPSSDGAIWKILKAWNQWSKASSQTQTGSEQSNTYSPEQRKIDVEELQRVGEWSKRVTSARVHLKEMKEAGLVKSLDVDARIMRVDLRGWMALNAEEKRTLTTAAAYYVSGDVPGKNSYNPSSVRVLSDQNDTVLAEFDVSLSGSAPIIHH